VREQGVLLAFDEPAVFAAQPRVLALAHRVERIAQVAHDVELVEHDPGLGGVARRGIPKRLPHIHQRQLDALAPLGTEFVEELVQARLRAIGPAEPDGALAVEIAHHDPIGVPLADGDLVEANRARRGAGRPPQLLAHVLLVQLLDGLPVELELARHLADRRRPTAAPHEEAEPLCVEGVVGQPVQALLLHGVAPRAVHPAHRELEVHPRVPARQIADPAHPVVVKRPDRPTARAASCFFRRRTNRTMRAFGSPNTPPMVASGRHPGNRYSSSNRRRLPIGKSCQVFARGQARIFLVPQPFQGFAT
jgi:hypothetical protein